MNDTPFMLLAGPCVIESEVLSLRVAERLRAITAPLGLAFWFKASFDKANRTAPDAFRGPGLDEGLRILCRVRDEIGVSVVTDIHEPAQAEPVAEVADMLQIPAFLCRQTDLLVAAGRTGRIVNLKKPQFAAPEDMAHAAEKVRRAGCARVCLTERGTFFGYHNLVVDFRSLDIMADLGYPVIFDATHSVQQPSRGSSSGGDRRFVEPLARAAAAWGVDGLFLETHPDPDHALCDGPNSLPLDRVEPLLRQVLAIRDAACA
ncbi:MAG TPA: 3-deoxy-8-phosphooctulonate synthase [Candidatus Hydrogenedentes bacterium]|nr:3-deoxy-8-phosphooctulonate synthase [Candidatus Hydrogenedentota bacterium]HOJ68178.1 3-deoxy-8-phosphooctulonate synthase [Candidatus Hydrogenedentota bacterium]HOK90147.1 3-deoxy-8-phosphooctulonate synthase [Candidatus Hydrogenedentota bacterium]